MTEFKTHNIEGIEARIRTGDQRKCVVMLHGIGSNAHSFDRLAGHLPEDWMLVAWNAPGYGGSRPVENERPLARDYADRLRVLVDSLGLKDFMLVGHSLGTLVAVDYASRFADHVKRLVLVACAQGYEMADDEPLPEKASARLNKLGKLGVQEFARRRAPRLLFKPELNPEILDEAITAMSAIDPSGYAQAVHLLAGGNLSQSARLVRCASLVVVGAEDVITPPEQSEMAHRALVSEDREFRHVFRVIQNAGHLVHLQQAALVAAEITAFARKRTKQEAVV